MWGEEARGWGTGWNVLCLPDCCIGMSYREEHKANLEERRVGGEVELFLQRQTLPPGITIQGQRLGLPVPPCMASELGLPPGTTMQGQRANSTTACTPLYLDIPCTRYWHLYVVFARS